MILIVLLRIIDIGIIMIFDYDCYRSPTHYHHYGCYCSNVYPGAYNLRDRRPSARLDRSAQRIDLTPQRRERLLCLALLLVAL